MMRRWPVIAIACTAFLVFWLWRDYPWTLALLAAIAVGVLAHVSLKTFERLRDLYRPAEPPEPKANLP
jgi:hypothetical protein